MSDVKNSKKSSLKVVPFALVLGGLTFVLHQVFRIETFWNDPESVRLWMGRFLGQDLQGMAPWQSTAARWVDLMLWSLLFMGWLNGARAVWTWHKNLGLNALAVNHLSSCAHHVCAAWGLTLLLRPVRNLLVQWHLPFEHWLLKWQYSHVDGITLAFCLCLLTLMMLARQWEQTDQENKGFI